jgi:hypothetical protein
MIGPNFPTELQAAGLMGLSFSWSPDGTIYGRENLTTEQNAALDAVIAAHDPNAALPRTIAGAYFRAALTNMGLMATVRAALTDPIDLELFNTATEFYEAAPDVNAVATALGISLASVFDAAEAIRASRQ